MVAIVIAMTYIFNIYLLSEVELQLYNLRANSCQPQGKMSFLFKLTACIEVLTENNTLVKFKQDML